MAGNTQVLREYLLSLGFKIDTKGGKDFTETITNVEKLAKRAGLAVVGLGVAAAAMAEAYAQSMEKLFYSSQRSGSTVKQIQALQFAGEKVGISSGEMQGAIEGMAAALRSNPALAGVLKNMGVKVEGRTSAQVLLDTVDALKSIPNRGVAEQFAALGNISPDLLNRLTLNNDKIREFATEREKLDSDLGVDVDKNAKAMVEWENSLRDVGAEFKALEGVLATKLLPTMQKVEAASRSMIKGLNVDIEGSTGIMDFFRRRNERRIKDHPANNPGDKFIDQISSWLLGGSGDGTQDIRKKLIMAGGYSEGETNAKLGLPNPGGKGPTANERDTLFRLEQQYALPPGLLDSVWAAESNRGQNLRSPKGAKGPFQFMSKTAEEYGISGQEDDFLSSATAAAQKYAGLLKHYGGDVKKAAAAYNYGEGNFEKVGNNLGASPAETRAYAARVAAGLQQTNNFYITGSNAKDIANAVGTKLANSNGNTLRDMKPVVQ